MQIQNQTKYPSSKNRIIPELVGVLVHLNTGCYLKHLKIKKKNYF